MVVTLVITGVDWTLLQTCGGGPAEVGARGTFEYHGDRLVMREPGIPGQATFAWSSDGTVVNLVPLETDDAYAPLSVLQFIFGNEFTRVAS
jgi:hypothetical protein